jgi:hypothetical protein
MYCPHDEQDRERRAPETRLCPFGVHWKSVEGGGAHICFLAGIPRGGVYREPQTGYWYIYPRFRAAERVGPFALLRSAQERAMRDYFAWPPCGEGRA